MVLNGKLFSCSFPNSPYFYFQHNPKQSYSLKTGVQRYLAQPVILSLETLVRIISYLINGIKTPPHSPRFTLLEIARQYPCEISQLNGEMYFHFSSIHNLSFLENDGGYAPSRHSSFVPGPAHSDSCSIKLRSDPKLPLL